MVHNGTVNHREGIKFHVVLRMNLPPHFLLFMRRLFRAHVTRRFIRRNAASPSIETPTRNHAPEEGRPVSLIGMPLVWKVLTMDACSAAEIQRLLR